MAEKHNATCSICGKGYHMCLSCKDEVKLQPWKKYTDTSDHYKVFQILKGYSTGVYTKKEAKSKLQNVDLSDMNTFKENIQNLIDEIMGNNESVVDIEEVVEPIELPVEVGMAEDTLFDDSFVFESEVDNSRNNRKKKSSKVVEADEYAVPTE